MKFIYILSFILLGLIPVSSAQASHCMVLTSTDDVVANSFRAYVDLDYSGRGAGAACSTSRSGSDNTNGFNQSIRFNTDEVDYWGSGEGTFRRIVLGRRMSFNNNSQNLIIGNPYSSASRRPDELFELDNLVDLGGERTLDYDWGRYTDWSYEAKGHIRLDASALGVGVHPFDISADNRPIILRNMRIRTNGIGRAEFFVSQPKLRDGGAVYICPGEWDNSFSPRSATLDWCPALDGDGDGYIDEGHGFDLGEFDCDDLDAGRYPGAYDIPGDGIDQDCDGSDATPPVLNCVVTTTDPDTGLRYSSVEISAGETRILDVSGRCTTGLQINYAAVESNPHVSVSWAEGFDGFLKFPFWHRYDGSLFLDQIYITMAADAPADVEATFYVQAEDQDDASTVYGQSVPITIQQPEDACVPEEEIPNDGIDQDCDGSDLIRGYPDRDGDGFGDDTHPGRDFPALSDPSDLPEGWVTDNSDCNDDDPSVYPGATEIPDDGIDQNCDGSDATTWYPDRDRDGFGDDDAGGRIQEERPTPGPWTTDNTDCDDGDGAVNPDATEICDNGIDDDCDGLIDELDTLDCSEQTWYPDEDGDGFGDEDGTPIVQVGEPEGYTIDNTDCDDDDGAVNPAAEEICDNGIDDNCDGLIDLADNLTCPSNTWYYDADGDGYGDETSDTNPPLVQEDQPVGYVDTPGDCNDFNPAINPGAEEIYGDGIDQNCDGADAICELTMATSELIVEPGSTAVFGADLTYLGGFDTRTLIGLTDLTDQLISLSATPALFEASGTTTIAIAASAEAALGTYMVDLTATDFEDETDPYSCSLSLEVTVGFLSDLDQDGDGYIDSNAGGDDCDDQDAGINPGAEEICGDSIDQNCDGIDDICVTGPEICTDGIDNDGDELIDCEDVDCIDAVIDEQTGQTCLDINPQLGDPETGDIMVSGGARFFGSGCSLTIHSQQTQLTGFGYLILLAFGTVLIVRLRAV